MLIKCRECANGISETAPSCPFCGFVRKPVVGLLATSTTTATSSVPTKKETHTLFFVLISAIIGSVLFVFTTLTLRELVVWWDVFARHSALAEMTGFVYSRLVVSLLALAAFALLFAFSLGIKSTSVSLAVKAKRANVFFILSIVAVSIVVVFAVISVLFSAIVFNTFYTQLQPLVNVDRVRLEQDAVISAFLAVSVLAASIPIIFKSLAYKRQMIKLSKALASVK